MSLLYQGLRQGLSLAVELYFIDVQATGRANIPATGPVIFAANHPNSIMDTVILGTQTNRQISYMAKSGLFKNPLVRWLFNECGVIPVHRKPKDGAGSNEDAFRRAYQALEEDGTIGIFPEGRNSREREMYDIKTGTARIALGAEKQNDYQLGVHIVPVGLNFENRDRFLSRVLLRFGEPIDCRDFAAAHKDDEREAVRELTDLIQSQIRDLATHIEGEVVQGLVRDIYRIYGPRLLENVLADREEERRSGSVMFDELRDEGGPAFGDDLMLEDLLDDAGERDLRTAFLDRVKGTRHGAKNMEDSFFLQSRIAKAISYFQEHDPEMFKEMQLRVWAFKAHLRQVHLRNDFVDRPPETLSFRLEALKFTAYMIVFFLPAAWGFAHNVIPYAMTRFFSLRAPDEAQRAITGLLVGMAAYPLMYAGPLFGIYSATIGLDWHFLTLPAWIWWTAFYFLSMPTTGFFFLRYRRQLAKYRDRILTRTLFQTDKQRLRSLISEREVLLDTFDRLRDRFLAWEEQALLEEE